MNTDIGVTGGSAGYGITYSAGKKTGKTYNDDRVEHIVRQVEERARNESNRPGESIAV